jgi:hypothetical protein
MGPVDKDIGSGTRKPQYVVPALVEADVVMVGDAAGELPVGHLTGIPDIDPLYDIFDRRRTIHWHLHSHIHKSDNISGRIQRFIAAQYPGLPSLF